MSQGTAQPADTNHYFEIFRTRLERFYQDTKLKGVSDITEKQCLEAYCQAGLAARITTKSELEQHINEVHHAVFGLSIEQRATQSKFKTMENGDFKHLDTPAWERMGVKINLSTYEPCPK